MAAEVNCNDICQTGDSEQICLVCSMAKTAHGKAWEGPVRPCNTARRRTSFVFVFFVMFV